MAVGQRPIPPPKIIRFGVFEADLRAGELRKNGLKIRLRGQPFEVLALLLERPGEVVTREELQKRLWADGTFVDFDHSLNTAINKIREALGDSAESPRFVETLSRRGYRFIAPVETRDVEVAFVSADDGATASMDPHEGRAAESSVQFSESQEAVAPSPSRPLSPIKQPWLSQRGTLLVVSLVLLLLVAFFFWWSLHRPTAPRELVLTRLTSDSGLTTDAVISPDGKLIAYASDRGGSNLDIFVKQISGGDPIQLTRDPADDHQPAFSPDGSQIVFRSEREGGGIYIISTLGGEERMLAPEGRNPRFSPVGDWIAFGVGGVIGAPLGAQEGTKIYLIPPTGGAPKPIGAPSILASGCPIWSPDGNHLLFYGSDSSMAVWFPTSDWWVWPLAGGNAVKTGAFEAFAAQNINLTLPSLVPAPAEWMDDRIFFSAKMGDSVNLWQVSISPKNWRITGPAHRLTTGSGLEIHPSLTKTGILVFSSLAENVDIWSLPIDAAQGRVKGPLEQLTRDLAADYSPSMSADGKKLAFVSLRSGNQDIWMKDLVTGKEKALATSPAEEISPRISPDGSLVSYAILTTGNGSQADDNYVIQSNGGLPLKHFYGCGRAWGWSPDNNFLFLRQRSRDNFAIGLINLTSGNVSDYLQSSQFLLFHATLTHDSRWITFNAFDKQAPQLQLSVLAAPFQLENPPKENDWIRVVSDQNWNDKPRWSPDEKGIYFVSNRDGFACLWMQPLERETKRPVGPPLPIYHIHQARRSILNVGYALMDISVATDKIVLNLGELTGNIWMAKLKEDR